MTTKILINRDEEYFVEENEFNYVFQHEEFNNLRILESLDIQERIISLLQEISKIDDTNFNLKCLNISHGGFIPLKLTSYYKKINVIAEQKHYDNLIKNIKTSNIYSDIMDKNYDILFIYNILINLEENDKPKFLLCPT